MNIDSLILGAYETNCYVLRDNEDAKDCLIVDTGLQARQLMDFLAENKLNPTALVLTHGHADHIGGVNVLREKFSGIKVYIHKLDAVMLTQPESNLSLLTGGSFAVAPADVTLNDADFIEEAHLTLEVLHTPGHTPGGICLYCRNQAIVFVGDTLFADSVGRTDFPGGDMNQLITSIKQKLCPLPDRTVVYPGHGPTTTIGREKAGNPFLR